MQLIDDSHSRINYCKMYLLYEIIWHSQILDAKGYTSLNNN